MKIIEKIQNDEDIEIHSIILCTFVLFAVYKNLIIASVLVANAA